MTAFKVKIERDWKYHLLSGVAWDCTVYDAWGTEIAFEPCATRWGAKRRAAKVVRDHVSPTLGRRGRRANTRRDLSYVIRVE